MTARTSPYRGALMVQGTTSDAGKSVLVAGLCRVLARRGIQVAPFKPQNMALNSAVTPCGGEIGRAQAVQARACGIEPEIDFNPVLLKPNTDTGAQVIIHGKAVTDMEADAYHHYKTTAMSAVMTSYERLLQRFQAVIIEGAGSPAEINLRDRDIANMGFAEAADCPVILVADIDRGGVFAHLVGTLQLLSASEQQRVLGFVINRFRGDMALLQPGIDWLQRYTGKPVFGTLPYLQDFHLEAEDAINTHQADTGTLRVCVLGLSRISNHTDVDALRLHPQVDLQFVRPGAAVPGCELIIIPGSKSVRSDLAFLRAQGWDEAIVRHLRYGGKVLGICGGFQMLGTTVADPNGIEGEAGSSAGLGLLEMTTEIMPEKQLKRVAGELTLANAAIEGYEIHAGISRGAALAQPFAQLEAGPDGAISADQQIIGSYIHGLFDHPQARQALLQWAGLQQVEAFDYQALQEREIERLADCLEQHLDLAQLFADCGIGVF